jgi:hypothetical protein
MGVKLQAGPVANRSILAIAAAVLALPSMAVCRAQMHGGGARPAPGYRAAHNAASAYTHQRGRVPFGYFLGDAPYFYGDYAYDQPAPEDAPQFIAMQPAQAAETSTQNKPAPLLIELEGDRYVRYGGTAQTSGTDAAHAEPVRNARAVFDPARSSAQHTAAIAPVPLVPTILVYRDGRREQIPDYAIVGRTIYAHSSNNAQPVYGMRRIDVSMLDIPATVAVNRDNGVSFVLPAGSNEVVTRP